MKRFKVAVVSLFAVAMGGCSDTYDPYYYDYTYYDPYWYAYDSYYVYGWVDPYGVYYYSDPTAQVIDLNAAATAIASRASTYYTPAGCAVVTASGPTVSYVFDDCEGSYGLTSVSGAVKLELSESDGQLAFAATSTDLTVGGEPFILDMNGTATAAGNQRTVMVRSRSRAPERVDSRDVQMTMAWEQGSGCVTLNGSGGSTRDGMTTTSTITDYRRCVGQCPSSGKVTVDGEDGVFTTEFNGSNTAVVRDPGGDTKNYDLQCQ
ncbi:MAG TPA: hypothetical protein VNA24_37415 [Hyalangium sp.]|jgi:hypothetical protein|nr:hypothetical protein [Hyalangium sp.]